MRLSRATGKRLSRAAVSRWLEWFATRMNGSASGRCSRPRTRSPMKSAISGRRNTVLKAAWTRCLNLVVVEVADIVEEHGRGVAQRVHAVEHPTVPGDQGAEVLDVEVALDGRHHPAAAEPEHRHEQRHPQALAHGERREEAHAEAQQRGGEDPAEEPLPGLVRAHGGEDLVPPRELAPDVLE